MSDVPFSETFPLEDGGDLTLTNYPDTGPRLSIEKNGTRNSWALTPRDVRNLREATGAIVLHHLTEAARS